jgi:hypothetical protein
MIRIIKLAMLSNVSLEAYRRMTPSQRLQITLQMMREASPFLLHGTPEHVARRFERLRMQNDLRNERMLRGIARSRTSDDHT